MKAWLIQIVAMLALTLPTHAQLLCRVSIKQVLDPNGNLPASGIFTNQANAVDAVAEANRYLDVAGFGYRLELTDYTPVNNGMLDDGTPTWNLPTSPANVRRIEDYALANGYGWRSDAVNIYITQGTGAGFDGYASSPGDNRSTIMLYSGADGTAGRLMLHEIGHSYWLGHTFDQGTCCPRGTNPSCNHTFQNTGPGATGITDDLLPDIDCNYPDEIATNRFGRVVAELTPEEFALFNITYRNIMSYHPQAFLFSNRQRDVWAISGNTVRANTVTGRTHFVSNFEFIWGAGAATATSLPSVPHGLFAANAGDIIMIYAGSYRAPQTITQPVTLRASRGWVTIRPP